MEFISFRSKPELRKAAVALAELERRSKSDEYREIFSVGIAEKSKRVALAKYAQGEVSMGKAAELAGVSIWEFIELMNKEGIALNLTAQDILESAKEA